MDDFAQMRTDRTRRKHSIQWHLYETFCEPQARYRFLNTLQKMAATYINAAAQTQIFLNEAYFSAPMALVLSLSTGMAGFGFL